MEARVEAEVEAANEGRGPRRREGMPRPTGGAREVQAVPGDLERGGPEGVASGGEREKGRVGGKGLRAWREAAVLRAERGVDVPAERELELGGEAEKSGHAGQPEEALPPKPPAPFCSLGLIQSGRETCSFWSRSSGVACCMRQTVSLTSPTLPST